MNMYTQSQDGNTYHWEVHHPRAPADQFRLPPTVEDNPVYSPVILHHFELAYTRNCACVGLWFTISVVTLVYQ